MKRKPTPAPAVVKALPVETAIDTALSTVPESLPLNAERVGNLDQKEKAISEAGLTRLEYLMAFKRALTAKKLVVDKYGTILGEEDDYAVQLKAAADVARVFGDMKEFERQLGNVTFNRVTYQWLNAPSEGMNVGRKDNNN